MKNKEGDDVCGEIYVYIYRHHIISEQSQSQVTKIYIVLNEERAG